MINFRQLNELRKKNEFYDLIRKSEDVFKIKVHKNVFPASNYFKDLIRFPIREKYEILLPDIIADVLDKIITLIYTNEFEEEIEDFENIIKYAVIFKFEQLIEIYSIALSESMTDHIRLKYWRLEDKCLAYIANKADQLLESSLMCDLAIEEMRSLLADNRLHLQCNDRKIFDHVWKWAEGKVAENKSFSQVFSEVIDLLYFSKFEKEFVFEKMFDNEDVLVNTKPTLSGFMKYMMAGNFFILLLS